MKVDERFKVRKCGKVVCDFSTSIITSPETEWTKEEERVCVAFVPEDYEDKRRLDVRMSRKEAGVLGERLLAYSKREIKKGY